MSEHDTRLEETRIPAYVYTRAPTTTVTASNAPHGWQGRCRLQDRRGGNAHAEVYLRGDEVSRVLPFIAGGALLGAVAGLSFGLGNYTAAWIVWLLYFGVVEVTAVLNSRDGDTLSEHVWLWFGTQRRKPGEPARKVTGWVWLRRFALLAFVTWLALHFLTGGLV